MVSTPARPTSWERISSMISLPGIRPLPPATEDVEDVDVRLFIQATGGDNRKIGARIRAGGQVDEGADLERRALDDGEFTGSLESWIMGTNRPGLRAGGTATGMRGVGCGEGEKGHALFNPAPPPAGSTPAGRALPLSEWASAGTQRASCKGRCPP